MSTYDMLPEGSQVKCWDCEMKTYQVGDTVSLPPIYVVLLREGGYVRVEGGIITKILEARETYFPEDFPGVVCIDKWGKIVQSKDDLRGTFGRDYYDWLDDKDE